MFWFQKRQLNATKIILLGQHNWLKFYEFTNPVNLFLFIIIKRVIKIQNPWTEQKSNWQDRDGPKNRDEIFEKRKGMACFECGSLMHLCYSCPELNKREPNVGIMNNLCSDFDLRELFNPFLSKGKINDQELQSFEITDQP